MKTRLLIAFLLIVIIGLDVALFVSKKSKVEKSEVCKPCNTRQAVIETSKYTTKQIAETRRLLKAEMVSVHNRLWKKIERSCK
jgi:hypothetical protein